MEDEEWFEYAGLQIEEERDRDNAGGGYAGCLEQPILYLVVFMVVVVILWLLQASG